MLRLGKYQPLLHLGLFLATWASTWVSYWVMFGGAGVAHGEMFDAFLFATCLMLILGAHEMGHYLYAIQHGVDSSMPYFIPLPLLGFGTLGAIIQIRGRIPNRNALVDIGAAGPLAGLLMAIPVLVIGMSLSEIVPAPRLPEGFPGAQSAWNLFYHGYGYLASLLLGTEWDFGGTGNYAMEFGESLLMWLVKKAVHGELPPGHDVYAHPMVVAGWFGCLVTMLNLVPIGQTDGGHLSYAVMGRKARTLGKWMSLGLLFLVMFFSIGWVVWLFVTTKFIGFRHPSVVDEEQPLTFRRYFWCLLGLVAFVLCLIPVPVRQVMIP